MVHPRQKLVKWTVFPALYKDKQNIDNFQASWLNHLNISLKYMKKHKLGQTRIPDGFWTHDPSWSGHGSEGRGFKSHLELEVFFFPRFSVDAISNVY